MPNILNYTLPFQQPNFNNINGLHKRSLSKGHERGNIYFARQKAKKTSVNPINGQANNNAWNPVTLTGSSSPVQEKYLNFVMPATFVKTLNFPHDSVVKTIGESQVIQGKKLEYEESIEMNKQFPIRTNKLESNLHHY